MMIKNRYPLISFVIILIITFYAYEPGVSGYFFFDDHINIVENTHLHIHSLDWSSIKNAASSGTAGMFGRPISMASFAMDFLVAELSPGHFKITNIVIHLLNGICIYVLSLLLFKAHRQRNVSLSPMQASWVSVWIAAAWLLHPLNMSSVLYVVQRMTSLSSLFTFIGLITYTYGRLSTTHGSRAWVSILASFLVFTPLAILSKENGALLPVFLFLTELIFFRFEMSSSNEKRILQGIYAVCLLLPALIILGFIGMHPEWITDTYKIRNFSLSERLMTEARVLWFYIRLLFVPDITSLGMFHDDIPISKGVFEPLSTLPACIGIVLLMLAGIISYRRYPIAAFSVLFFLIGHSMESSFLPLELVHEHRNYLPSFGLIFALFFYLFVPGKHNESTKIRHLLGFVAVIMLAAITFLRATQWGDAVEMKLKEVAHHPQSVRANLDIAAFYAALPPTNQIEADEYYNKAYNYYAKASSLSTSDTLGLIGLISLHARKAMPIETTWGSALSNRLAVYPFAPNTGNSMANLIKCVIARNCKDIDELTERLFRAALSNPTLKGRVKIEILFSWSDYLAQVKHAKPEALLAAREAAEIEPRNLDDQLNLLIFLINLNATDDAKLQIKVVRSLDTSGIYTDTVSAFEKSLAQP